MVLEWQLQVQVVPFNSAGLDHQSGYLVLTPVHLTALIFPSYLLGNHFIGLT